MNPIFDKIALVINLICLPINVLTFKFGFNQYRNGHHYDGIFFMLLATICFVWCGSIVITRTKKLLQKG